MAYYLAGPFIGNEREIQKALLGAQIGDVADPNLVGSSKLPFFNLIGKYRQIMPRLSGAWKGCWLWLQEQPLPGQALEKAVAADLYTSLSQLGLELSLIHISE